MAHYEDLRVWLAHGLHIKAQSVTIEPPRARLHVIPERQPEALELADFFAVLSVSQVNDVRDAQCLEFFDVPPGGYRAPKCQPPPYPKHPHPPSPLSLSLTSLHQIHLPH